MRVWSSIVVVGLCGSALAQATQPGYQLTPELRAKMEAINRKASSRPSTAPAADDPQRSAMTIEAQRAKLDRETQMIAQAQNFIASVQEIMPQLTQDLTTLRQQGQAAEAHLNAVLDQYEALRELADKAGHSTFSGNDGNNAPISGTIYNPSERLAAIMQVENQYGPELREARQKLQELYTKYSQLAGQYQQQMTQSAQAKRVMDAARIRQQQAAASVALLEQKQRAATRPTTQP